jgi:hypothetical protein
MILIDTHATPGTSLNLVGRKAVHAEIDAFIVDLVLEDGGQL